MEEQVERFWDELAEYPELEAPELRSEVFELAVQTCSSLDVGLSWDAIEATAANVPEPEQTLAVSKAAVIAFCPEHLDKME